MTILMGPQTSRTEVGMASRSRAVASIMTSAAQRVEVVCPGCGFEYEAWHRPSINLTLGEEWTEEEIRQATTARCPACGLEVDLTTLIVGGEPR